MGRWTSRDSARSSCSVLRGGARPTLPEIYDLTVERLEPLEGFQRTSAENLIASIDAFEGGRSRARSTRSAFLGIGGVNARTLAEHFGSIDALMEADAEQVAEVPGIGPVLAGTIVETFAEPRNRELVERLRTAGLQMSVERAATDAPHRHWRGRRSCSPGRSTDMSRDEATARIPESLGGKVTGSVSGEDRLRRGRCRTRLEGRQGAAIWAGP